MPDTTSTGTSVEILKYRLCALYQGSIKALSLKAVLRLS
jgi:hypothetical protein